MNVVLVMFRENGERRSFSLSRDVTVIGRREDAHFRIPLTDVSRKHCRIIKDGNSLLLEDLGSSNGTYHNDQRVQEAEIHPGDTLRIGPVQFVVQIDGVPSDEVLGGTANGSGGSGLIDSAATMVTPAFTSPPVPPLPAGYRSAEASQPTIDEAPLELGDDEVAADDAADDATDDDLLIEADPADLEPAADAEVVAESSFVVDADEEDAEAVDDLIIEDEVAAETGEADEAAAEDAGESSDDVVIPTDIVIDEHEARIEEDLPDFSVSPPTTAAPEEPAAESPVFEAAPAPAEEPPLDAAAAEGDGFDVMHDSSAGDEEAEDDVLIDFDLPDDHDRK